MKKEELVNIISSRLSSQGKETAVAFDVFIQKVAESLQVNESVKIPEVGIFQLKRKGILNESGSQTKGSFYLLFVPLKYSRKDKNEVLAFQVNPRNIKKSEIDDDVFSLSVDQPLIPVTEQARKDFLVHSSYLMMQKNFEDRVEGLLLNSVNLSDFEIDYSFPSIPEENKFGLDLDVENETQTEDKESIPWDFGEEESFTEYDNRPEAPVENENFDAFAGSFTDQPSDQSPSSDEVLDEAFKEKADGPDDSNPLSETEEVLNDIMPEDGLKLPDDLFKDLLGEDETQSDEIQESRLQESEIQENELQEQPVVFPENSELSEDWFSLKEIDENEEETPQSRLALADEETFSTEQNFEEQEPEIIDDQTENIDVKLELLTEMDAGLEIDPFEDFPLTQESQKPLDVDLTAELPEEEPAEEKPAEEKLAEEELFQENKQDGFKLQEEGFTGLNITDDKMLEDEDEAAHKVKYPGTFWMILGALILVTLGGVYYFFFMGKSNPLLPEFAQKKTAAEKTSDVKPQIIERDYSVPVTVYKRSTENPGELQKDGSESAIAQEESKTAPQNNAPLTEAPKTVQEKKPENTQQLSKSPPSNTQANKPAQKSNSALNNNSALKQNQSNAVFQVQPRSDTKDKLIKQDIFTDGRGHYTIQESSWQSMNEAVKRVNYFRSRGLDAYYTRYAPKGAKVWYRVRIGDFPSLEETENTLKRIR